MSRVLACGGRDYRDASRVTEVLTGLDVAELCEGGANGADALAALWAHRVGIPVRQFNAQWETHGKAAGPIRNQQMLDEFKPDLVVAFPGGRGTAHMVSIAKRAGVEVIEVPA